MVVKAREGVDDNAIRERLAGSEFVEVPVQRFGDAAANEYLLRVEGAEAAVAETTMNAPDAEGAEASSTRLMALLNQLTSCSRYQGHPPFQCFDFFWHAYLHVLPLLLSVVPVFSITSSVTENPFEIPTIHTNHYASLYVFCCFP